MMVYGKAMHHYVMRELEVGYRVAMAEDSEAVGWGPMWDLIYSEDIRLGRI